MEELKEKITKAEKIIDNELFMRHLVFKNRPSTYKKKKAEMELVKDLIQEMAKMLEAIDLIGI